MSLLWSKAFGGVTAGGGDRLSNDRVSGSQINRFSRKIIRVLGVRHTAMESLD
jgi:hypothetical protein